MRGWQATARTVFATAAVTSAAWLIGGALWLQQERERWRAQGAAPVLAGNEAVVARAPRPASPEETVGNPQGSRPARVSPAAVSRLIIPVAGVGARDLVDTFTQARAGGARRHDAIDILAPRGTPVLAATPGEIEKVFLSEPGGKTVYVRSPDRTLITYYAHLDAYAPGLREGQQVRAGQPLGTVGTTGNADPAVPHLHFAVMRTSPDAPWWEDAVVLNPYPLLTR